MPDTIIIAIKKDGFIYIEFGTSVKSSASTEKGT